MTTPPDPSWPEQDRGVTTPGTSPAGLPPAQPPNYPGYPIQRPTNGLAIASLVLGIFIFWLIPSILALIFGYISRNQIRERNEGGAGLAMAGIVLGWVGVGLWAVILLFALIGAALER